MYIICLHRVARIFHKNIIYLARRQTHSSCWFSARRFIDKYYRSVQYYIIIHVSFMLQVSLPALWYNDNFKSEIRRDLFCYYDIKSTPARTVDLSKILYISAVLIMIRLNRSNWGVESRNLIIWIKLQITL